MRELERGEAEWARARREDMEAARREFIHLAEKLGIPGDEAERFLDARMRGRHRPPEADLERVIFGLKEENERLRMHVEKLTDFVRRLEERLEKLERAFRPHHR